MDLLTKLISALAQILWPILGFCVLLTFKKEIADILRRIKKGKMLGQEIELTDSLAELRASAETVKESAANVPSTESQPTIETLENVERDEIKQILDEATKSPRVALITLGGYIEIAALRALASLGMLRTTQRFSVTELLDTLSERVEGLPANIASSMKLFMDVRNKIVHARGATQDDIISALDSGITILRTLKSLPIQTTKVLHTDVRLFSDPECLNEIRGRGVIVETASPGGVKKTKSIYPTLRNWFEKGQEVSWEWEVKNVWNEAWYIDPDTGEKLKGWFSSGEFIGRSLETIYRD